MNTASKSIKKIASITGLFLGAFALSALATDWTPATQVAPAGNTAAPINVSLSKQSKAGPFAIGTVSDPEAGLDLQVVGVAKLGALFVNGDLTVPSGKTYTNKIQIGNADAGSINHVLTKIDAAGNAEWKPASGGSNTVTSFDSSYCYAQYAHRWVSVGGLSGYYLKGMTKYTDNDWDAYGGVYCLISGSTDSRMTESKKAGLSGVVKDSIGKTYNQIVADCSSNRGKYGEHTVICPAYDDFAI